MTALAGILLSSVRADAQVPGPNVNMVSGTTLPDGDPYLQRQNEPSGAVSTRNPLHLLAGSNDYRTVDMPGIPDDEEANGDAWFGVFKSFDAGQTWHSTLIPGYPQDQSAVGKASPIHGFNAGADPIVRAGTNGLFYYAGIAFNRGANGLGKIFVARFLDNNNDRAVYDRKTGKYLSNDPLPYIDNQVIDSGTAGKFIDKPFLVVDKPRGTATCTIQAPGAAPQTVPAGDVYLSYIIAQGNSNPNTKMMVAKSSDCGATWGKPVLVSQSIHVSQGATMAIDPATGALYVAWREIADSNSTDSMVIVKSINGGKSFGNARRIASIHPFDQGGSTFTFRTRAYPSLAVDENSRVYVAWSERGIGPITPAPAGGITVPAGVPLGDARIVVSSSRDGSTWTAPQPIDSDPSVPGHQIMPTITVTAGKVTVLYYDFRNDVSGLFEPYIYDGAISSRSPHHKRHTMDVRVWQTDPANAAGVLAPSASVQVSQYTSGFRPGSHTKEQLQYNAPNLPLYAQGTVAFIGDYIDIATTAFVPDATGTKWDFNVKKGGPSAAYAIWTDNRDVRPPTRRKADGTLDWTSYTPATPSSAIPAEFRDPAMPACVPGSTGMRNANIYMSRITPGLFVGAPTNAKKLNGSQKSFVVFVQNATDTTKTFRLTAPAGASFLQTTALAEVDVTVSPRSTTSRTVYTSAAVTAPLTVTIVEVGLRPKGTTQKTAVVSGGLTASVVLNPDVTNPDVTNPDVTNVEIFNPDVTNPDVTNPDVTNPDVTNRAVASTNIVNPDVTNPDVTNPDVTNPDVTNPDVTNVSIVNPDVTNPDVTNPDVTNPDVTNPDVTNPDVTNAAILNPDVTNPDVTNAVINPDVTNPSITDVSWTVKNNGTTAGSFAVKPFLTKNAPGGFYKQLILHKTYATPVTTNVGKAALDDCTVYTQVQNVLLANILNPDVTNPDVTNPDVTNPDVTNPDVTNLVINPDVTNASVFLEPGDSARITLRVLNPDKLTFPVVTKTVTQSNGVRQNVEVSPQLDAAKTATPLVAAQGTNPPGAPSSFEAPIVVDTLSLPDGAATVPYLTPASAPVRLLASGGISNARSWCVVTSLPADGTCPATPIDPAPGLTLDPTTGVISGTPTTIGAFRFMVQVRDASVPPHFNTQDLFIRVAPIAVPDVKTATEDTTLTFAASDLLANDPAVASNGSTQSLVVTAVTPGAATHGTVTLVGGQVTFVPAPNYNGSAAFTYTSTLATSFDGFDATYPPLSATGTVTVTIAPVNDAPAAAPAALSTSEDTALPITLAGADTETAAANLVYAITTTPAHGTLGAVAGQGVTYTPAANYNGPDSFAFTVTDRGDPDNCGAPGAACTAALTSAPATVSITVVPVNDAPSFTKGADQTVFEDAGPQTVPDWATAISRGPSDESAQQVDFIVLNSNNALFSVQPAIAPNGTLTYTPAANANGVATVNVQLHDNGGHAPGIDLSAPTSFTITVTAVNDAPGFVKGADQTVVEDAGPQSVAGWATGIGAGPADEAGQAVAFLVSNDNAALFAVQPTVTPGGTLQYATALHANGVATVTVRLQDNGGVANGGIDTSAAQTFTITVTGVQHPPVAVDDAASGSDGAAIVVPVLANDSDPDNDPLSLSGVTLPAHGSAVANGDGTITYTSVVPFNGADAFSYTIDDGHGHTATANVSVTVTHVNRAPTAVNDTAFTSTNQAIDINVTANDTDPDNGTGGSLLASFAAMPTSAGATNEMAVEPVSGRLYATTAFQRVVALDPTAPPATTVVATIGTPSALSNLPHAVNRTTGLMYFRMGPSIAVINPATNQLVASLATNGFNVPAPMAVDDGNGVRAPRLYLLQGSRILAFDADPTSPTSHQVVNAVDLSGIGGSPTGIAFNKATNRLFIAHSAGLVRYDVAAATFASLAGAPAPTNEVAVDAAHDRIFAAGTTAAGVTSAAVFDGANESVIAGAVPVQGSLTLGSGGKHFAVNTTTGTAYLRTSDPAAVSGWVTAITAAGVPTSIVVGRDSWANVDIVVDEALNKVVTIAERDLRVAIISGGTTVNDGTTPTVVANIHVLGITNGDIELDAARHIAYVSEGGSIHKIDLNTNAGTRLPVTAFVDGGVVNTQTHQFYAGTMFDKTTVSIFDQGGAAGEITGLPNNDGRLTIMAADRSTNTFYAANLGADVAATSDGEPGFVSAIDATGHVTASLAAGNFPSGLAVNSTTHKVYVGNLAGFSGAGTPLTELDFSTSASTPIAAPVLDNNSGGVSIGRSMVVNEGSNRLYFQVISGSNFTAGVLDMANGNTVTGLPLSGTWGTVRAIAVNQTLNRVYIGTAAVTGANAQPGRLHVLDGTTHQELATLDVYSPSSAASVQQNLAVDTTRGLVYVGDSLAGTVSIVDGTGALLSTLNVCSGAAGIALNTPANRAYVACPSDGSVAFIDGNGPGGTFRIVGRLPVPYSPVYVYADAAASLVFTAGAATPTPGVNVVRDANGTLDGVLTVATAATPTTQGGTTSVNGNGTVHYAPPAGFTGLDSFTYTATDGQAPSAPATVSVTVSAPPTITAVSPLPSAALGQPYAFQFTATGGTGALTWTVVGQSGQQLPNGMSLSSSGLLTGRPTNSGVVTFTVQVTDSSVVPRTRTGTFTIAVGPLTISTTNLTAATLGAPYSFQLSAGNSTATPFAWSLATGSLPPGLSLDPQTGIISGTPAQADCTSASFTVRVTDFSGATATRTFQMFFNGTIRITTTALNPGVVLQNYSSPVNASCGNNTPRTWTLSGALPAGESFAASQPNSSSSFGSWAGGNAQPKQTGTFPVDITVSDGSGSDTKHFDLKVFAIDQQSNSQSSADILFGGAGGRKLAQTVMAGANGTLTAFGLTSASCTSSGPVLVEIQGVQTNGTPDGVTVASGSATSNFGTIAVSPALQMAIGQQFAAVVSSPTACSVSNAPSTVEGYPFGDGYSNNGGGWTSLVASDGRYDIPFRTLIQPAVPLAYLTRPRSWSPFSSSQFAAPLSNGKVLLIGTDGTAELVDPATNTSTATGSLNIARSNPTVTQLLDGTVLVAGGSVFNGTTSTWPTAAEIYTPGTGQFTLTAGSMVAGRAQAAAVRLADGRVLFTGGFGTSLSTAQSAEIYDPATQTFSAAGSTLGFHASHAAVLLASGKVLLVGGSGSSSGGEVYDPVAGTFTATAGATVVPRAFGFTATRLDCPTSNPTCAWGGMVLLAGGSNFTTSTNTAELYNPTTNSFSATGSLGTARATHSAVALPDGSVLMAGGTDTATAEQSLATLERYQPASGTFAPAGGMEVGRSSHVAVRLPDNRILLAGGTVSFSWLTGNSAEFYDPASTPFLTTALPDGQINVGYPSTTLTAAGGSGSGYQFAIVSGSLPAGLSYAPGTSTISGTPTAAGIFTVGVSVTDGAGHGVVQPLSVSVNALRITTSSLQNGAMGHAYTQSLAASGGVGAVSWSLWSGQLPGGLVLTSGGVISGTPTSTGFSNFRVRATDAVGQVSTAPLYIQVNNPLVITTASPINDTFATFNLFTCFSANFGNGALTWSVDPATTPLGPTLQSNGCFDGAQLLQAGTFSFNVTVTDSSAPPQTATKPFTLRVHALDQQVSGQANASVSLPSSRRVAQVFTSSTPFALSGVQLGAALASCSPNTQITASVYPVTGSPAQPDDSGGPLGSLSVTYIASNNFNPFPTFASPIAIPQHGRFAVVLSFANGSCAGTNWQTADGYGNGDGWVNDGGGWVLTGTPGGLNRADVPIGTTVLPPTTTSLTYDRRFRSGQASVTLQDGRVLIIGSDATAEIYDPGALPSPTLTLTAGTMSTPRYRPTATLMPNGDVLIVGGAVFSNGPTVAVASTEIFHPGTGQFSLGPSIAVGRYDHTATLLTAGPHAGQVLIAGGQTVDGGGFFTQLQSAYLLDATGATVATLTMQGVRWQHTATLLPDGQTVLIAGGWRGNPSYSAEVFDSSTGSFTVTAGPMVTWRANQSATLLTTGPRAGQVLLAGGYADYPSFAATSEFFDPGTASFAAGPALNIGRANHTATEAGGHVVITGGRTDWLSNTIATSSIETLDGNATAFTLAGDMLVDRSSHTAEVLAIGANQGKVFVIGGSGASSVAPRTVEIVDPSSNGLTITTASLLDGETGHAYLFGPLTAAGGTGSGYSFSLASGSLPPSNPASNPLTLQSNGVIQGVPTATGRYSFVVKVTDDAQPTPNTAYRQFTFVVDRLTIASSFTLPSGVVGAAYLTQIQSSGGSGALTWTLDNGNALPPGLSLNAAGVVSGTPANAGWYYFNVKVSDGTGQIAAKTLLIQVQNPLSITTASLTAAYVQNSYNGCIAWSGGASVRTWSISSGALPAGVTLDPGTGCFGGAPIQRTGPYSFTVRVQDNDLPPQSATHAYTLRVGGSDQSTAFFTNASPTLPIDSTHQLAQTFRQQMTGSIIAVQAPIACTPSPNAFLAVDIRPVDGLGQIDMNGAPLVSQNVDVNQLPPFQNGPYGEILTFSSPLFAPQGVRLAAVFSTPSGQCQLTEAQTISGGGFDYAFGDGFSGTGGPISWTAIRLADSSRPDLPINTIVDPNDALDFMPNPGRAGHTATTLADGRVLMTGTSATYGASAVVYDPATRTFTATSQQMNAIRQNHSATTLQDGRVLLVGGRNPQNGLPLASAEIYDPANDTFTPVGSALLAARWYHTASLLPDGRVLIAGGENGWNNQLDTSEIFDPANNSFSAGPTLAARRAEHTATTLATGDVLLVGGFGSTGPTNRAERYVPAIGGPGSFVLTNGQPSIDRASHTATMLGTNQVLVLGGWSSGFTTPSAELYDPGTDAFTATGSLLTSGAHHGAARLNDGRVLIAGGDVESGDSLSRLEIYDPIGGTFTRAGLMPVPRAGLSATLMSDGRVLLAGGYGGSNSTWNSADRFDPAAVQVSIDNPNLPDGHNGVAYGPFTLTASGGTAPYRFAMTSGSLPPGLAFTNGVVSGTPTASGSYDVGVRATDAAAHSIDQSLRIRIDALDVTPNFLPGGQVGFAYDQSLSSTGGVGSTTWELVPFAGVLPNGLMLQSDGTIVGTPTQAEVETFAVVVTDSLGQQATWRFTINVIGENPPVAVDDVYPVTRDTELTVDTSAFNGLQGLLNNDTDPDQGHTLTAVYLSNPVHGTLNPHANGSFSYTPNAGYVGSDSFTYKANDGLLDSNVATVTLDVTPPTHTVPTQFATIQAAIDAASNGDVIQVAAGTYHENLVWTNKDIQIVGAGAATTIVDGGNTASVLSISGVPSTASISGFTFTHGQSVADVFFDGRTWGGGVLVQHSQLTIADSIVTASTASGGAGIALIEADATIVRTTLSNNTAVQEGGGVDAQKSSPLLLDDVLVGNSPDGLFSFNDISGTYGSQSALPQTVGPTIVNTLIAGNTGPYSASGGAGLAIWGSKLVLINDTITRNNPGGFTEVNPAVDTVTISNSILYGNVSVADIIASAAVIDHTTIGFGSYTGGATVSTADPLFVNPGAGDYRLQDTSPAVNAGLDGAVPPSASTDLDRNPRFAGTVDQGPYENPNGGPVLLGPAGGPGGSPYGPLYCNAPNTYAVGFEVNGDFGYALTSAALLCNDSSLTPKFGGGTTPNQFVACNPGDRMVGFLGTDDGGANYGIPVVSSVGARCLPTGGGAIYSTFTSPGSGPSFGPFDCPAGQVVVGVQGGNGAVVDRIQLICGVRP